MSRLSFLLLTAVALVATVLVATASAKTIRGTARAEVLRGTSGADKIYGGGGNDKLYGLAGNDTFYPGAGIDTVYCGAGVDHVLADAKDKVAKDCEIVLRPKVDIPPQPTMGSRTNPVPLGREVALGDGWKLKVESVTPDATAAVLAASDSNDPPPAGWQFFMARVTATYVAPGSDRFEAVFRLRTVGAAAVSYSGFENSCGEIPDELSEAEIFTGGTISGNACWAIRSSDSASLVLYDDPVQTVPKRIFLSLR
jgi:hypothetical protein